MIPKIETNGQLNHLIDAIKMSVPDTAWHDASLWHEWFHSGEWSRNIAYAWNEVWSEDECRAILTTYTALRLGR